MIKTKKSRILAICAIGLAFVTLLGVLVPLLTKKLNTYAPIGGLPSVNAPAYGCRDVDYGQLYVQDGLVANYMAYDGTSFNYDKEEVSGGGNTAGYPSYLKYYTWTNLVHGGKDAILRGHSGAGGFIPWELMNGGIGYTASGKNAPLAALELPYQEYVDGKNYEIEVVALFSGIDLWASPEEAVWQSSSTFRFGLYHSNHYLTASDAKNFDRVGRWYASNDPYLKHYNSTTADRSCVFFSTDYSFHTSLNFFAPITMYFSNTIQGDTMYPHLEYRQANKTVVAFGNGNVEIEKELIDKYEYTDSVSRFTLFNGYPCTVYGVRLYDRALTTEEKQRNNFIDYMAYYNVNAASILKLDKETRDAFLNSCGNAAVLRGVTMGFDQEKGYNVLTSIINDYWPS